MSRAAAQKQPSPAHSTTAVKAEDPELAQRVAERAALVKTLESARQTHHDLLAHRESLSQSARTGRDFDEIAQCDADSARSLGRLTAIEEALAAHDRDTEPIRQRARRAEAEERRRRQHEAQQKIVREMLPHAEAVAALNTELENAYRRANLMGAAPVLPLVPRPLTLEQWLASARRFVARERQ